MLSAIAETTTKTDPTQSIGCIIKPKTSTEPIVAENGSKASSKLAVDGLMKRSELVINWNGIIVPITITAKV